MKFVPSLELSRMLYEEKIAPIIEQEYPELCIVTSSVNC
jgi:hypothetical protein